MSVRVPGRAMALALLLSVVVACAGSPSSPPSPPASSAAAAPAGDPVAPGALRLTGALRQPLVLDAAALAARPQTDATVTYQSSQGAQTRRERGVPLAALLPPDALATDPARKNDLLTVGVLAVGADGYQALVSYGEISPDFGNRGLLVSLTEDGAVLPRPRLVAPGDVKGGRYVSDLVELRVVRVGG